MEKRPIKKGNLNLIAIKETERIILLDDIQNYFETEVQPSSKFRMNRKKDTVGYQINFTKYFYKFVPPKDPAVIRKELISLEDEIKKLSKNL